MPERSEGTFTVTRVDREPHAFEETGRIGLLRLVQVEPPPKPDLLLLRTMSVRLGVVISLVNKVDPVEEIAPHGMAVYELKVAGQSVQSMNQLEVAIDQFSGFLNAGSDPGTYVQAMYGTPTSRPA